MEFLLLDGFSSKQKKCQGHYWNNLEVLNMPIY